MKAIDVQRMLDHCAKLIEANQTAYVDRDTLSMARFIIEQSNELADANKALAEALELFDAHWCSAHGHAPKPEAFDRAIELWKRIHPHRTRNRYP